MVPSQSQVIQALSLSPLLGTLITVWFASFASALLSVPYDYHANRLYGITCLQIHQYYNNFSSDSIQLKTFVTIVFALETVHAVLVSHYIYFYLVAHFGELKVLARTTPSVTASVFNGLVIAFVVNQYFVRKVYILSGRKLWLAAVISFLATLRPALGFAAAVISTRYPEWAILIEKIKPVATTGLGVGVLVDGLIAVVISYFLLKEGRTAVVSTRNIVNILVKYTINTGSILMVGAVLEVIGLVLWSHSLAFIGIFQIQTQLYANCVVTNLNARHLLRQELQRSRIVTHGNSDHLSSQNRRQTSAVSIKVTNESFVDFDQDNGKSEWRMDTKFGRNSPV